MFLPSRIFHAILQIVRIIFSLGIATFNFDKRLFNRIESEYFVNKKIVVKNRPVGSSEFKQMFFYVNF